MRSSLIKVLRFARLAPLLCATPALAFPFFHHRKPQPAPVVPLSTVAQQVLHTLDAFNAEAASRDLPQLSKVTLDFNATASRGADLSFNILVFSVGAHRELDTTDEVTFTYTVPPPSAPSTFGSRAQPAPVDLSATLLTTLESAAAQVKGTQTIGAARFSNLTVTLAYGVVSSVSGGGSGTVSLVTLAGNVSRRRSDVQTLTLSFGQ